MAILDQYGRPFPTRPDTREIAVLSVRDRWSTYPSQGLTPERLATIFKEADQGDVYRQVELFEEMEEKDPHLFSILQTRKLAVLGLDWEVMPYSDKRQDKRIAEFVGEVLYNLENFEDVLLDLLDAIGKGFSVSEIMWSIRDGNAWIDDIRWRPPKKFTFDEAWRLRLLTDDSPVSGVELPPGKFITHIYKAKSGHPSRAGVLRVCGWMYLFKNYDIKDWVAFAEVYGRPLRLGKYKANATKEDKDALMQALVQLGVDAAGIVSESTVVEFIEAKATGASIYSALADFCNREMSKAVLGQTLTSEVGSVGSYAASKVHQQVRQDLLEADCRALAKTLRRDVIKPLVMFNFGEAERLPWIKFHYEPPEDMELTSKVYATLVKDVGLPISQEHVYEKFGIPKPEEGQALVSPPGVVAPREAPGEPAPMKTSAVLSIIQRATSLEGLRDELAKAYPGVDPDEILEGLVAGTLQVSPPGTAAPNGTVALSRSPRGPQEAIDSLADQTLVEAQKRGIFKGIAEPVLSIIQKATSLEGLRDELVKAYPDMDTSELEDLVARATFVADLIGRVAVDGELED